MQNSIINNFDAVNTSQINTKVRRGFIGACPRCMNGNMYKEINEEYVCLQCGYRVYPKTDHVALNEGFHHKNLAF